MHFHANWRRGNFIEWKWYRAITFFDQSAFRRPVGPNHVFVIILSQRVYGVAFDYIDAVRPDCDYAVCRQNSVRFGIKTIEIEPVDCLRHCDKTDRIIGQSAGFRGSDAILDLWMRRR